VRDTGSGDLGRASSNYVVHVASSFIFIPFP
jgi:hypothetical protein